MQADYEARTALVQMRCIPPCAVVPRSGRGQAVQRLQLGPILQRLCTALTNQRPERGICTALGVMWLVPPLATFRFKALFGPL